MQCAPLVKIRNCITAISAWSALTYEKFVRDTDKVRWKERKNAAKWEKNKENGKSVTCFRAAMCQCIFARSWWTRSRRTKRRALWALTEYTHNVFFLFWSMLCFGFSLLAFFSLPFCFCWATFIWVHTTTLTLFSPLRRVCFHEECAYMRVSVIFRIFFYGGFFSVTTSCTENIGFAVFCCTYWLQCAMLLAYGFCVYSFFLSPRLLFSFFRYLHNLFFNVYFCAKVMKKPKCQEERKAYGEGRMNEHTQTHTRAHSLACLQKLWSGLFSLYALSEPE